MSSIAVRINHHDVGKNIAFGSTRRGEGVFIDPNTVNAISDDRGVGSTA